ncbi:MAG TPA: ABC transporter substrate-binding protein [Nocardioidaceae bacterium]|nr:ABC transporter substrate-binding protein [Nocardioidaceae bacterium]
MTVSLAACGGDDGGGGSEASGGSSDLGASWILGTTDKVTSLDPAGAYDLGSWTLMYNMYQTLLTIPAGENKPQGDAAQSCKYTDPQTFTCTLKDGLTFANGNALTSSDVKFSLERNIAIADPNGASGLLSSITSKDGGVDPDAIETPSDTEIVFHLNKPDTTWQFVLTTNAAAIVDEEVFPADDLIDNTEAVGSGPFSMDQYEDGQQAVLTANPEYDGPKQPQSERVFVSYFQQPAQLKQAVENGDVDVAWRSLSPTDINDLKTSDSVEVIEGDGSEIRYFVWQLGTPVGKDKATRQAVAELIDREAIAKNAYSGTVDPLYSLVPPGFVGQIDAFAQKYGENSVAEAKKLLSDAGIQTPVNLSLGYTPSHYGPNAVDEANELARQLEDSGLFNVEIKSAEWTQYQNLYKEGAYDLFQLGWFPDFLDADNYLSPFLVDGGFYANNYSSERVNKLIAAEQAATNADKREEIIAELQRIVAEDVPVVPSWVGKNIAVAGPGMTGVESTLGPAFIFRMWLVSKEG